MSSAAGPSETTVRLHASRADLPTRVLHALDAPPAPTWRTVPAGGIPFAAREWGEADAPPILLIHGITSSSAIWWRLGPALAAGLGRRIVAVDQAGHGRTGHWTGHWRFADNAADIAAFTRAAGIAGPSLRVVGHSWGAMTAAALPAAGLIPEVIVLLDPPAIPLAAIGSMVDDPVERHYDDLGTALELIGRLNPTWPYGDVLAKAEGLTQFVERSAREVLTLNGDWDGGLADLAHPAAAPVAVRVVRGEPDAGGLVPDDAVAGLAARVGPGNVVTIDGGSHSPMRTRIEATTLALLRALQPTSLDD